MSSSYISMDLRDAFPEDVDKAVMYNEKLISLGVDESIGAELTLSEIRELLPEAAVMDRIRMIRYWRARNQHPPQQPQQELPQQPQQLQDAASRAIPLPNHPSWKGVRLWFEAIDWDPNAAREQALAQCVQMSVPASLLLGIIAAALLEPAFCSDTDDSSCLFLFDADMIFWIITFVLLVQAVLTGESCCALIKLQKEEDINVWLISHWFYVMQPLAYFTFAITFTLPIALILRIWLLLPDNQLAAIIVTVIALCTPAGFHFSWHNPARLTMDLSWSEWLPDANNGYCFGLLRSPTSAEWLRSLPSKTPFKSASA